MPQIASGYNTVFSDTAAGRAKVRSLKNESTQELLTILFYLVFFIFSVAIFRENFIILFIFHPMFYEFSSGQRQPFATRLGHFFNHTDVIDYSQVENGRNHSLGNNRRFSSTSAAADVEGNALINGEQNKANARNEDSIAREKSFFGSSARQLCRVFKKIISSQLFINALTFVFAASFVYLVDINGWAIRQFTHNGKNSTGSNQNKQEKQARSNDEVMLYASLFIVVSCMALDPSLIICRLLNYYETSLLFNKPSRRQKENSQSLMGKLNSFLRKVCYLYDAPIWTRSGHKNVFLDQVENIFIGSADLIQTDDAPDTFYRLREAGCRFWLMSDYNQMSTMEIARHSGLLATKAKVKRVIIDENQPGGIQAWLQDYDKTGEQAKSTEKWQSSAIVLDAETFARLRQSRKCTNQIMQWISGCKAFIGCDLNAEQKADILENIENRLTPEALTLAIGSKAEDKLMMEKAHISVGIQDRCNTDFAADYIVNEFRTVNRLLLLHGMSNQRRMYQMRCFILFESAALRTVQFIWVLSSFVPELVSSIDIFGSETIYYVNWLTLAWDVLFWFAAFLIYGPLYKYRGPNQKQRRPRELITRVSHTRRYINATLKFLMTSLGVALGIVIFSFTVKTFEHANALGEASETKPIPDHTLLTIDYLASTNLILVLCLILVMETRKWACLCALIPLAGFVVYWFFKSLSGVAITLPNGLEQTSAASSLLKLNFSYWSYSRITFGEVWLPLALLIVSVIIALICLFLRSVFRQLRRKKYYNTHYSRRLVVGKREREYPTILSDLKYFCSYKLYPKFYRAYSALKTFGYFTGHLVKIYFKCKIRTALCMIAVLQLMVFDNFWYIIGSIFGLAVPFLISLYDLIKKKCSPGRAVRRSYEFLDRRNKRWEERGSQHIKAGDAIKLQDGDMVPADAILLSTSDLEGKCTYDPSFINGVANVNYSHALKPREKFQTPEELCLFELDIKLQDPWKQDASRFEATVTTMVMSDDSVPNYETTTTSEINWLLGGYRLKGTEWAICLIVYDDLESKMNLDAKMYKKFIKKLHVHEFQYLGRFLLGLFTFFLFLLFLFLIINFSVSLVSNKTDSSGGENDTSTAVTVTHDISARTLFGLLDVHHRSVLSYLLGLVKIFPTPLLAILSLIRLFETELEINRDKSMNSSFETNTNYLVSDRSCFSRATSRILGLVSPKWKTWLSETLFLKVPTRVKTSSLNAFLGRVENVFIEKTGVLSKNHGNEFVTLKRCSTSGKIYDLTNDEIIRDNPPDEIDEIFTVLALAKDAYPADVFDQKGNSPQYKVENVLAEEVAQFGYFVRSSGVSLGHPNSTYNVASDLEHKISVTAKGKSKLFRFLYRLPIPKVSCFIVRDLSNLTHEPHNEHERGLKNRIYAIGAPEDMKSLLQISVFEKAEENVVGWAKEGLTTLCIAWRDLSLEDLKSFIRGVKRNEAVDERAVREFLTGSLHLFGTIALDDVRGMIRMLLEAKCRIAVLTGDNLDVKGIENFCRYFLPRNFHLHHFRLEDENSTWDWAHQVDAVIGFKVICLDGEIWEKIFYCVNQRKRLEEALKYNTWLIAYSLEPYHKKEIIDLICKNVTPGKISMAIGNGLSDVPMLRRAHIGVVVRGERPGEDVKAQADYVIGEFRFLKQLLHHGVLGKRNSFKLENVLWYEMLMFNMMPFVWFTMAIRFDGKDTSILPFGENYTLPFLGAMAICYALLIYWSKRNANGNSYIDDSQFSEEYFQSREQGRSNTLRYLVLTGIVQCFVVKILTWWLFVKWNPLETTKESNSDANLTESFGLYNASHEDLDATDHSAFYSLLEITFHICIQSALVACLLQGKRRFFTLLPLFSWICYLTITSKIIRKQPFLPEMLHFPTFFGRFLIEIIILSVLHGIAFYSYRLFSKSARESRSPKDVLSDDVKSLLSIPANVSKFIKTRNGLARTVV